MTRTRVVRTYPAHDLKSALVLTEAIITQNAGLPIDRKLLAETLNTSDRSSSFVTLLAASQQYGLTVGKYNSNEISVTELSKSIFSSVEEESYSVNLMKASYNPDKFKEMKDLLQGQLMPEPRFLKNLISQNIQIHKSQIEEFIKIYTSNDNFVNKSKKVDVSPTNVSPIQINRNSDAVVCIFGGKSTKDQLILDLSQKLNLRYVHVDFNEISSSLGTIQDINISGSIVCLPDEFSDYLNPTSIFTLGVANGFSPGKVIVIGMTDDLENFLNTQIFQGVTTIYGSDDSKIQLDVLSAMNQLGILSLSIN